MKTLSLCLVIGVSVLAVAPTGCATRIVPPGPAPASLAEAPAEAIRSRDVATRLASQLKSDFVFPEQGSRYAAMLNANAEAGRYDALVGLDLARRLTEDLQGVAADGHLRVMYKGEGGGQIQVVVQRPPDGTDGGPVPGGPPKMVRIAPPPAVETPVWLVPGVAFVRFNLFPGEPETVRAAQEFMATHADAETLIFDLRTHMGGGLDEMDAIFPWLFAEPTRLLSMATRKSVDDAGGSPVAGVASMRRVESDPEVVVREHWVTPQTGSPLSDAKVYVLTSSMTGSAAEHFALALKRTGRATLIGRTTYGAGHFGGDQDLGGGFTAFIPVGRTYDPETGDDWEGDGVEPDIDVAPDAALAEALKRAGVAPEEAARLSADVAPKVPMADMRRPSL